jgi:WhiB family redox-sensing transcriptional regulator
MSGRPLPIYCLCCNQPGLHGGRGLIADCYTHHTRAGTLHHYPTVRGNTEWQRTRIIPAPASAPASPRKIGNGEAACRSHDPEIWFPVSVQADSPAVRLAKSICRGCPVLAACGAYVRANPQEHGIWAGLTPAEQRQARLAEGVAA